MAQADLNTNAQSAEAQIYQLEKRAAKAEGNNQFRTAERLRRQAADLRVAANQGGSRHTAPPDDPSQYVDKRSAPFKVGQGIRTAGGAIADKIPEVLDWMGGLGQGAETQYQTEQDVRGTPEWAQGLMGVPEDEVTPFVFNPIVDPLDMTHGTPMTQEDISLPPQQAVHGDMPYPPFQPEALPMTHGTPMTQEDIQLPDAFGVPQVSTQDNAAQKQIIDSLTTGDTGRGGEAFDPATGISDEGPLAGARGKVLDWMNIDNDEHAQRLGSAMMGFGSGVLTGGSDLGAAIGHGFAKGADQFVSTKKDQTQRMADLQAIEQADLRLDMEREEFDEWRRDTARKRSGEMPDGLIKLERDKKIASSGYIQDENGQWIEDPNYVKDPYSNITDKKIRSQIEMLDLALKTGKITEEQYQQGVMALTGFEGLGV